MKPEISTEGGLTLELHEDEGSIRVNWLGKSTAREPGRFILSVLLKGVELSTLRKVPLVLDFQNIAYMNSSTITPIIRLLEQAKRATHAVRLVYKKDLKWQSLNFTALNVFQTDDKRIEIVGV
jgi:hypothetical protein